MSENDSKRQIQGTLNVSLWNGTESFIWISDAISFVYDASMWGMQSDASSLWYFEFYSFARNDSITFNVSNII